jgi:hypothetical protein
MPKRHGNRQSQRVFRVSARRIGLLGLALILSVTVMTLIRGCRREPPYIGDCTRLEVHYIQGAFRHFLRTYNWRDRLFNEEERSYVKSFDTWTVTDKVLIKTFAHEIGQGTYKGRDWLGMEAGDSDAELDVACYRDSELTASFTVTRYDVIADGKIFEYPLLKPDVGILTPPELKPLLVRRSCARRLRGLYDVELKGLYDLGVKYRTDLLYPDPNRWCDDTVDYYRGRWKISSEVSLAWMFACPSVDVSTESSDAHADMAKQKVLTWRSGYAMNPHCRRGSPANMVLLFESTPGWNQHGGPELFTFDNHDPKGGCVLLNDGTVKFIRTEEELQRLRWK